MSASRRRPRKPLLSNHQRSWIWGKHAVRKAIRSDRWRPIEVRLSHELDPELAGEVERTCSEWDIDCDRLPAARLKELCHSDEHQGLIARMPEYPYLSVDECLENLTEKTLLLVLDQLHDAFNFGACLRCAEVFGVDAVIVGARNQSGVNSQVVRSSAGAIHHTPIVRDDDLTAALSRLKQAGVCLVAASEKADGSLPDAELTRPLAIVIGNEGRGIETERLALCDRRVAIPQCGRVDSLNAAVAAGILLYEAVRQLSHSEGTSR